MELLIKFAMISFLVCHPRFPRSQETLSILEQGTDPNGSSDSINFGAPFPYGYEQQLSFGFEECFDSSSGLPRPLMHDAAGKQNLEPPT